MSIKNDANHTRTRSEGRRTLNDRRANTTATIQVRKLMNTSFTSEKSRTSGVYHNTHNSTHLVLLNTHIVDKTRPSETPVDPEQLLLILHDAPSSKKAVRLLEAHDDFSW